MKVIAVIQDSTEIRKIVQCLVGKGSGPPE
jgi:hypothetical protein